MTTKKAFGATAIERGYVTEEQVEQALATQREQEEGERKLLGIIMLEAGALDNTQLIEMLQALERENQG